MRSVAKLIGYSPGTLYQLFADQDEMILRLNAQTLDGLIAVCRTVDFAAGPEAALAALGRCYIAEVNAHRGLWNAVFEHSLAEGRPQPEWFAERTARLLGFAAQALAPLFADGETALLRRHVEVLWAGLYGIAALAAAGKLSEGSSPEALVETLVSTTVAGLRAKRGW